jgi:hypothetical protein
MSVMPLKLPEDLGRLLLSSSSEAVALSLSSSLVYVNPSISVASTGVRHGRGLVANHGDAIIRAGDVLFVTPPAVEAPIDAVLRVYQSKASSGVSLEDIAETILIKEMKRCLRRSSRNDDAAAKAASFMALQHKHCEDNSHLSLSIGVMCGEQSVHSIDQRTRILTATENHHRDDDYLKGIIRQNAFGPDFHHYGRMQQELASGNGSSYHRILGMYPLAALINHSCQTNATRTFLTATVKSDSGDGTAVSFMIATATQDILPGQEITWSYIPPTTTVLARQEALRHYGFICACERCQEDFSKRGVAISEGQMTIQDYEEALMAKYSMVTPKEINGDNETLDDVEMPHSIRLAFTNLYIQQFNEMLSSNPDNDITVYRKVLDEASKLHQAFSHLHKASTEHLSIVHLCYDLATILKNTGNNNPDGNDGNMGSTIYWMEKLKESHKCRYSHFILNDLSLLKVLLQHTKIVLRTREGWQHARYQFI